MTKYFNNSGFTLIEMTIVIVIASIVVAAALSIARPYYAQQQIERTATAVRTVDRALAKFLEENERYPCPASLTAPRGSAEDGVEDCTPDGTAVLAVDGQSHTGGAALQTVTGGVLVGALPYRALDIPVSSTLDAASNRLTYAVSRASTNNNAVAGPVYDDDLTDLTSSSAVLVVDESGTSISQRDIDGLPGDEDLTKHYFFFSHGNDGAGAYSDAGILNASACGGTRDSENCDMDGVFVSAARSLGANGDYSDDVSNESLVIENDLHDELWAITPSDENNIYNLNDNNVGVGTDDPTHRFHVSGGTNLGAFPMNPDNGVLKIEEDSSGAGPAPSMVFDGNQILSSHSLTLSTAATASNATNAQNFLALGTNNSERLRITFDGDIGIGTTTPQGSKGLVSNMKSSSVFSADRLVDIDLPGWSSQQDIQLRVGDLVLNSRNNGSSSVEAVKDRGANGNLVLGAQGSIVFNIEEKNSSKQDDMEMIINGDGNVGLGTNEPQRRLHIYGESDRLLRLEREFPNLKLPNVVWDFGLESDRFYIANHSPQASTVTIPFVIREMGDVGIGTMQPQAKLDVAGEVKLGFTGVACSQKIEGAQRYNPKIKDMEFCDGVVWRPFGGFNAKGPVACYGSQGEIGCGANYGCNSSNDHAQCPAGFIQIGADICSENRLGIMCQKVYGNP